MSCVLEAGPNLETTEYIIQNLRERDKQEIFATRWGDDLEELVQDIQGYGEFQWTAVLDGTPVAIIGACPMWPGVWSVWAFGTEDWPKVVLKLTRHARQAMIPALHEQGAHRAECRALKVHEDACRWLELLGAHKEAELAGFGRQREDFILYVWSRNNVLSFPPKNR